MLIKIDLCFFKFIIIIIIIICFLTNKSDNILFIVIVQGPRSSFQSACLIRLFLSAVGGRGAGVVQLSTFKMPGAYSTFFFNTVTTHQSFFK